MVGVINASARETAGGCCGVEVGTRYVCSVGGGRGVWVAVAAAVSMVWDSRVLLVKRDDRWEVDDAAW